MAAEQPALHLLYRHIDDMNADLDKEAMRKRLMPQDPRAGGAGGGRLPAAADHRRRGRRDAAFAADIIAAVVPGARAVHIADTGHSAYFERAQVFNRHVAEFLDRVG